MLRFKWFYVLLLITFTLISCSPNRVQDITQLETRVAELEKQLETSQGVAQLEADRVATLEAKATDISDNLTASEKEIQAAQLEAENAFDLALTLVGKSNEQPAPIITTTIEEEEGYGVIADQIDVLSARVMELEQAGQTVLTTTVNLDIAHLDENGAHHLLHYPIDRLTITKTMEFRPELNHVAFAHIEKRDSNGHTLYYSLVAAPDLPANAIDNARRQIYTTLGDSLLVIQKGDIITFTNTVPIQITNAANEAIEYATLDELSTTLQNNNFDGTQERVTMLLLVNIDEGDSPFYELVFFTEDGAGVPGNSTREKCRNCQSSVYSWTYECRSLINTCQLFGYR